MLISPVPKRISNNSSKMIRINLIIPSFQNRTKVVAGAILKTKASWKQKTVAALGK